MNLKGKRTFVFLLALVCISCSQSPEQVGSKFLTLLQQHNFGEAAALSTNETAAIVLFMEEMLAANSETGEVLDLPIPHIATGIEHLSSTETDGHTVLEYTGGEQNFILYAIEIDGKWKIHLPRSSW